MSTVQAPELRGRARQDARARGGFGDTLLAVIAAGIAATAGPRLAD